MNKIDVIKKPFARKQRIACTTLCVVFTLMSWSCQDRSEAGQLEPLSDEQISINLSENGVTDPDLLIGEWDAIKFAYTADGHNISDVIKIKSAYLEIPVAPTDSECTVYDPEIGTYTSSKHWVLHSEINGGNWLCSLSGNSLKFSFCGSTRINVPRPHEELDMIYAINNAYSFVIKGNMLMIFFTEDEKVKNFPSIAGDKKMNLIIFKKR